MGAPECVLSPAQREAVADWLTETAGRLRLADWSIDLAAGPPSDIEAWAEVSPTASYQHALVKVDGHLLSESDDQVRRALVHEVVHLYHWDLMAAMDEAVAHADPETVRWVKAVLVRYVERMVDQVARVLVDHVGLPSLDAVRAAPGPNDGPN